MNVILAAAVVALTAYLFLLVVVVPAGIAAEKIDAVRRRYIAL